jgi:hypothetical protein
MTVHAFDLAKSYDDFFDFAASNWCSALPLYDKILRGYRETSLSDGVLGSFAQLRPNVERLRRFFSGDQGDFVDRFVAAATEVWDQLEQAWLNDCHRSHLAELAEQFEWCEPEAEWLMRESLLRCAPWTTLPWKKLEAAAVELVHHLPDFPKCCFNFSSLLAGATRRSQRTHMPLLVDVDAPSSTGHESWNHFAMRYVDPLLHELFRQLCRFIPNPATVEVDVSIAARPHDGAKGMLFSEWAVERLESVFQQTRHVLSATESHGMPADDEDEWPPDDGWHVKRGEAAFRGVRFAIGGYARALLEVLVKSRHRKTKYELMEEVWRAKRADSTFRATLTSLRRTLQVAFRLPDGIDPVPHKDGGWKLDSDLISGQSEILAGGEKKTSAKIATAPAQ